MNLRFTLRQIALATGSSPARWRPRPRSPRPRRPARTSPATSTTTPPARTARSRCRSWSRSRPTRWTTPWGLDWFVQAGHGGSGNRNCTLVEDATLATPAYPFVAGQGPQHHLGELGRDPEGRRLGLRRRTGTCGAGSRCRSSSTRCIEYLNAYKNLPLFLGVETVVPGHEHTSMSVITGPDPGVARHDAAAHHPGLHRARQRHPAGAVGVLLRPRRQRHQPRRHQQLGLLGPGQPERGRPELERDRRRS